MRRDDPVLGYNFAVTLIDSSSVLAQALLGVQLAPMAGFSECSGLEASLDIEEYKEGGNNGTTLKFPTRATWTNLMLKRGIAVSEDLWQWHYDFAEGVGSRRDGIIALMNDQQVPVRVWMFLRGIPIKWRGPVLNAAQSQVALEELEIAHEGLQLIPAGG